jgi:Domain of unknown function (DUF4136)
MKRCAPLALTLALSACASYAPPTPQVIGQVTVYHQWPAQQARSFAFEPSAATSLEQQTLAHTLAMALAKHGFTAVANGAAPDLIVSFSTQLDAKNMRVVDFVRPWGWGVTAWGGYGRYDRHRYLAQPFYNNMWAESVIPVERTISANQRVLKLMMATPQGQRVYEGAIVSTGTSAVMNDVLPALVDGLMARFPGDSARSWPVQVPLMAAPVIK